MAEPAPIRVRVAYALPTEQRVVSVDLPAGSTARDAVRASGLAPGILDSRPAGWSLGVFGRVVPGDQLLRDGDRVEIYRPLLLDPREARRRAAAEPRRRRP